MHVIVDFFFFFYNYNYYKASYILTFNCKSLHLAYRNVTNSWHSTWCYNKITAIMWLGIGSTSFSKCTRKSKDKSSLGFFGACLCIVVVFQYLLPCCDILCYPVQQSVVPRGKSPGASSIALQLDSWIATLLDCNCSLSSPSTHYCALQSLHSRSNHLLLLHDCQLAMLLSVSSKL